MKDYSVAAGVTSECKIYFAPWEVRNCIDRAVALAIADTRRARDKRAARIVMRQGQWFGTSPNRNDVANEILGRK